MELISWQGGYDLCLEAHFYKMSVMRLAPQ